MKLTQLKESVTIISSNLLNKVKGGTSESANSQNAEIIIDDTEAM
ncbi:MAG: hypothetical protein AAFV25_19705 [Bacteroidota bacterium]